MAHPSVVAAVGARLQAGFDHCPVITENDGDQTVPSDAGPFLKLQFPWTRSEWQTIDGPDGCDFLEEGGFRFVLSVPSGSGTITGRVWLEEIATLFRGQRFEGVQTYAPSSPVSDDASDAPGYFRLSIVVPYEYLIQG
jgi:hypothetical protein